MKKIVVCDLDGTLTQSKSALTLSMAKTINILLQTHYFAVISGGDWPQFEKQFLSHLASPEKELEHLFLFPTSGAECYTRSNGEWKQVYDELLTVNEKQQIRNAFIHAIETSGVEVNRNYGLILEDRGEQITFSGCGQEAPLEIKAVWDPDQLKRKKIVSLLQGEIPDFEINLGGMTSIDVSRKGINKAFALRKIKEILHIEEDDIVFLGDALYPGGNDEKARDTGVECISVSDPHETETLLLRYAQERTVL